ncbi:oxidoreductase [Novosphingobium mangrovi (ex Huang et al. 2023)]|uniref:Oxidoreductase n=1 Tax=Novosphingobium mangrovi (ex Huang et al. 2023) TaxID=2976432 RepID=A0ABT2I3M7_9SPHN|nr:oxidoreductase [Novosphingobium mangrovi (ex Huang et al. 2023)]MCT2399407.1 oxidoreductase [Novosphingobium mangrovi (ex Huang et al. 2023)]
MAKGFTAKDVTSQAGKCFLVTGANTGLGFEAAKKLAESGARVLLACRSEDKARHAIERIRMAVPGANLAFVHLDQADIGSVHECARKVIAEEPRLDVLVNNAGVMFPPLQRTAQGHELQFGVNHLAPFALTGLLLPKLSETPGARVVITSSLAHKGGRIDWDDLDAHERYSRTQRYSDSKLMNLLHLFELDRRLKAAGLPVSAMACHPGFARTDLDRHSGVFRIFFPLAGVIFNNAAQGAWATLQAATAEDAVPGEFYGPQRMGGSSGPTAIAKRTAAARDAEAAARLWTLSEEATGVRYPL